MNTLTHLRHRSFAVLFAVGMAAFVFTACNSDSDEFKQNMQQKLHETLDEWSEKAREARDQLIEETRKQLDAVNAKISDMEAKMDKDSEAASAEAQAALDKLKQKRINLQETLEKLENVTEDDWEKVKSRISTQIDENFDSAEDQPTESEESTESTEKNQ